MADGGINGIYGFGYSNSDAGNEQTIRIETKKYAVLNSHLNEDDTLSNCFLKWIETKKEEARKKKRKISVETSTSSEPRKQIETTAPAFILTVAGGASNFVLKRRFVK